MLRGLSLDVSVLDELLHFSLYIWGHFSGSSLVLQVRYLDGEFQNRFVWSVLGGHHGMELYVTAFIASGIEIADFVLFDGYTRFVIPPATSLSA